MLRTGILVVALAVATLVPAQGILELTDEVRMAIGGQKVSCEALGLNFLSSSDFCHQTTRSIAYQQRIASAIAGVGGQPYGRWDHAQVGSLWVDTLIVAMPDYDVSIMTIVPSGADYRVFWFSTKFEGGLDSDSFAAAAASVPEPPRVYVSDVPVEYEAVDVEGPHTVAGILSPTQVVLSMAGRRKTIALGGVAVAPHVSPDEATRVLTRTLLGQVVYFVEGSDGSLVFFRDADGAWNLGGQRAALVNARLVHEGSYVSDVEQGSFGANTASVSAAMENDPSDDD